MNDIKQYLEKCFFQNTNKCVLSNPDVQTKEKKISFRNIGGLFQREFIRDKKAFHKNLTYEECFDFIQTALKDGYRQFYSRDNQNEYSLKITDKGKILFFKKPAPKDISQPQHDKNKNHILNKCVINPILIDLGVLTKEGQIVNSMYDKYKQINRFLEIVHDELKTWDTTKDIHILDFGCGKSYLTFLLFHFLSVELRFRVKMTGVDSNPELIEKCREIARKYHVDGLSIFGKENLNFFCSDIESFQTKDKIDLVLSLHACDTATDYVLKFAIENDVKAIFAVPCCQKELNKQLKSNSYPFITRYGLIKERFAALLTDAFRANILECFGYKTDLIDFVDIENTAKNIMIRAVKTNKKRNTQAEIEKIIDEFGINQTLCSLVYRR